MFFSKSEVIKDLVGDHTTAVMACYEKYEEAMDAIMVGCEEATMESYTNKLRSLESQADEVRHMIIRQLLEGGMLVDSRKSLMHVIEAVDTVANITEDIVQEIYIQNICLPEFTHDAIKKMSTVTKKQLELLVETVKNIVHKYKIKEMTKIIHEIEGLESEVDDIQQALTKQLFETDFELARKLQYRELINMIGGMSDVIEDISDEIEIIMMARKV